jgi:hypothetical protein
MLYRGHLAWVGFELTTLVVIGTDCIGSNISSYHMITTTTAPDTNQDVDQQYKYSGIVCYDNWIFDGLAVDDVQIEKKRVYHE